MRLLRLPARLRRPKATVRWRLTLLYGGLFLVCGAALLAITYTLVAHASVTPSPEAYISRSAGSGTVGAGPADQVRMPVPRQRGFAAGTQLSGLKAVLPPQAQQLLRSPAGGAVIRIVGRGQQISDLHQLMIWSGIALAMMAVISAVLGWLVAGRVLRPLRIITASTQEISEANLHQRLALPGPRDELRQLADTIDSLLERLQCAFDAQRRFVANASHELRTPLTATRALLEMATSDPRATVESFRETCKQALEEGEQQERLIDALLALAQGERGIDHPEPVDLATVIGEVMQAYELDAAVHGVALDVSVTPAQIPGDRRLLARLASNLVENAIRHNHPSGRACVRVEHRARRAVLQVTNTGPPVPASEVARLLQPFQRLAPDRIRQSDGLGLGLSIVAAVATAHGAVLDVHPAEHGGLRVEVSFPLTADSHAPAGAADPDDRARPLPAVSALH